MSKKQNRVILNEAQHSEESLYEEKDLSCKINNTAHRVSRSQMIKITDFRNCTSFILIKFVRNLYAENQIQLFTNE